MALQARIIDAGYQDEYFSDRCGCTIPAMAYAIVEANTGLRGQIEQLPKCCADKIGDIVAELKRDGFTVSGPSWVKDLITAEQVAA